MIMIYDEVKEELDIDPEKQTESKERLDGIVYRASLCGDVR